MKKYAMLVLASAFMFSVAVTAQNQTPPQGERGHNEFRQGNRPQLTPEKRAERLANQLGLNDAEKAKVQALYEKQDVKMAELRKDTQKAKEEVKADFEAARKTLNEDLEKVIGKEKYQKMETMRAERQQKMKERREGNPPTPPTPPTPEN